MPKVSAQYLANKRKNIVEATIRVCSAKPAYEVTLRDVVRECGISTGGIYNYFASVDEIFVEILNQAYDEFPYEDQFSKIFESENPADEIIMEAFKLQGRMIESIYGRYGKFIMELDVILLNDPERGKRMIANSKGNSGSDDFLSKLCMFIAACVADGIFSPMVPLPHILFTIIGAISGLHKGMAMSEYTIEPLLMLGLTEAECASAESMMELLARVILSLLNPSITT